MTKKVFNEKHGSSSEKQNGNGDDVYYGNGINKSSSDDGDSNGRLILTMANIW